MRCVLRLTGHLFKHTRSRQRERRAGTYTEGSFHEAIHLSRRAATEDYIEHELCCNRNVLMGYINKAQSVKMELLDFFKWAEVC